MNKIFAPVFICLALLLPCALNAAGEAPAGGSLIAKCQDNISPEKKLLSPKVALECIKKLNENDGALLNSIKTESPQEAADLVAYNNALVDLANLTSKYSRYPLAQALAREMEDSPCSLCDMGLGPQPEKSFDWVSVNAPARLAVVKKSVRTWEVLGGLRTSSLALEREHYNKDSWDKLKILARYERLSEWARAQTDKLAAADKKNPGRTGAVAGLPDVLREDLVLDGDDEYRAKLTDLGMAKAEAETASLAKISAAGKTASELKGRSTSGQKDYLDAKFDKAAPAKGDTAVAGAGEKAFTPVPITKDQAAVLSGKMGAVKDGKFTGYLAEEIKGTKAGDELTAFFGDKTYAASGTNVLNLKFEKGTGDMANALGWWSGSDKTTRVNTDLVDDYCAEHKITPAQMLASEEHMKGVARYVAPNFVHETTHQRQDAWAHANGLDYIKYQGGSTGAPYQMEMETESFSMQAAFSAEKAKKLGPAYLQQISPSHKANAIKFMEDGVDALRTDKHELYPGISSLEGSASKELRSAKEAAAYLQSLENKNSRTPKAMTKANKADLIEYREMMNARFKWYTMVYKKSAQDEKKLLEWRDSFSETEVAAPPALGE